MGAAGGIVTAERRVQNVLWKIQGSLGDARGLQAVGLLNAHRALDLDEQCVETRAPRRLKNKRRCASRRPHRPARR